MTTVQFSVAVLCIIVSVVDCSSATCGGTLTNETGTISLPDVAPNTTCTWYIQRNDSAQTSMLMKYNFTGNRDSLSIYEGNETAPGYHNLTVFDAGIGTQMVLSVAKVTTVVYQKGNNVMTTDNEFTIDYNTKECEQTLQASQGFRSPIYNPGSGPVSCKYSVLNSEQKALFIMAFNKFSLTHGYLNVGGPKGTNLTGTAIPDDVLRKNMTKLDLDLVIDKSNDTQQFQVEFPNVNQECSGVISLKDSSEQVMITLPTATSYPAKCRQYIQASGKSKLVAIATTLHLTEAADIMIFNDGGSRFAPPISVFDSNTKEGKIVIGSGKTMTVRTLLQYNSAKRNFTLNIHQQANGGRFTNTGRIELKKGSQKSAAFPSYYLLSASSDSQVELVMNKTSMLPNSSIDVYDGGDVMQRRLVSFKSQDVPFFPVTSSGNKLLVVATNFESNQSFTGDFSSVSPGCSVVSVGSMDSYELKRKNVGNACSWTINPQLSQGYVLLKIKSANLCPNETVTLYQGLSGTASLRIATVTQQNFGAELPLFSSPAKYGIKVVLNHEGSKCDNKTKNTTALYADYTITPKDCGGTVAPHGGELVTPQYPNVYPLNSKCTWNVPNLKHSLFYLSWDQFQLGKGHVLNVSQVKGSVQKSLISFTGNTIPDDFLTVITNKTLTVKFDASNQELGKDIEIPGKGFNLKYKYLDCGGYITKSNGSFGISKAVSSSKECIWIVRLPKTGPKKSVNIVSFNLTSKNTGSSKENVLVIRDGGSAWSTALNFTKGSASSVLSRTNMLWVRYIYQPSQSNKDAGFTFNLKYTLYNCNSSQLCDNRLCLHPDWRCNGFDDCGDDTDERNCLVPPASVVNGVKTYVVVIIALLCFAVGVVLTIIVPAIYKRIRYPNYSQLRDMMEPSVS